MSSSIGTVGIVCEGSTDFAVLKAIAIAVLGGRQYVLLQPDFDKLKAHAPGQPGPGWQGVRRFLQKSSIALGIGVFDVVIVHVDADLVDLPEIKRELTSQEDDQAGGLDALCRHVKSWIDTSVLSLVIITLPKRTTATWLVAAHTRKKSVEGLIDPDEVLASAGLLERDAKGRPRKEETRYAQLAVALVEKLRDRKAISRTVPELERLVAKLDGARRAAKR